MPESIPVIWRNAGVACKKIWPWEGRSRRGGDLCIRSRPESRRKPLTSTARARDDSEAGLRLATVRLRISRDIAQGETILPSRGLFHKIDFSVKITKTAKSAVYESRVSTDAAGVGLAMARRFQFDRMLRPAPQAADRSPDQTHSLPLQFMEDVMSEPVLSTARCGSPSAALKLIRAAALAAALVPLGSIAAEAGPITCVGGQDTFFDSAFACETLSATYAPGTSQSNTFVFGAGTHLNTLTFDEVLLPFVLHMSAFYIDPAELQSRLPAGRVCEQYALPFPGACVYYRVEDLQDDPDSGPPQQGTHFTGDWEQEILWFSQGGAPSDAELWHDPRGLDNFDDNITVPGSYDPTPVPGLGPLDPLIRGSTDNFSDTAVLPVQTPEPSSLVLLGLGIGGLYNRFRRR